jgi:hypothetical protein
MELVQYWFVSRKYSKVIISMEDIASDGEAKNS